MTTDWSKCKNILCIRADNMGDLLMSSPAIRALKDTFKCCITVLTSSIASSIAKYVRGIDEVISYDFPWVKSNGRNTTEEFTDLIDLLKKRRFDAAVIFTVYSQNPLPAAMVCYMAGIPRRLAYCRENPYDLLTDWVPDKEPYSFIRHQVKRDLQLVAIIGASTKSDKLLLNIPKTTWNQVIDKLTKIGVDISKPWLILHTGVSEKKREFPVECWIQAGRELTGELKQQVLLTGSSSEKILTDTLMNEIGKGSFSTAGLFSIEEFISLVAHASLTISVNSGPIHIAAATNTPVIVLYALTNPQHLPWKVQGKALLFNVPEDIRSKNEVIKYVDEYAIDHPLCLVSANDIIDAVKHILKGDENVYIPELIPLKQGFGK